MFGFLNKDKIIADEKFNRWLVPPAALLIHLSIGMIYGFSVFWKRLTQVVGVECAEDVSFLQRIFVTDCDWKMSDLGWTFSLAIVFWRRGRCCACWPGCASAAGCGSPPRTSSQCPSGGAVTASTPRSSTRRRAATTSCSRRTARRSSALTPR